MSGQFIDCHGAHPHCPGDNVDADNVLDYLPLDLRSLPDGLPVFSDLYIKVCDRFVLYCEATCRFGERERDRLVAAGVSNVWIRASEDEVAQRHLAAILSLADEEVPPLAKAGLLYRSAKSVALKMEDGLSREDLSEANDLVAATASYLTRSPSGFGALLSVMAHDFSVYAHAVNVAVYAIGLARFTGITDRSDLQQLGLGAILHDVGKARIPKALLQKPGPLTIEEWEVMRTHPQRGAELLSANDISDVAKNVVLEHHERLDGSGYPLAKRAENLHLFSRVVALVDAYDAMTSERPYRPALSPYLALRELRDEVGAKFDGHLYPSLVQMLGDAKVTRAC